MGVARYAPTFTFKTSGFAIASVVIFSIFGAIAVVSEFLR